MATQRTAEVTGASPVYVPYVPQVGDKTWPHDLQDAADYYLTSRGKHPNAPNKILLTSMSSMSSMVAFTGFDRIDTLLTQRHQGRLPVAQPGTACPGGWPEGALPGRRCDAHGPLRRTRRCRCHIEAHPFLPAHPRLNAERKNTDFGD